MTELLLGIDIGTSSSKGVIADTGGAVLATAERAHSVSSPRPGWAEHDPEEVWWDDFVGICKELMAGIEGEVAAVCASGIGPCALVADEEGRPLRPAILYGIDTRSTHEIDELTARYGADAIIERCGSPLTSQAVGPKLAWVRRNEPETWTDTRWFLMASSFIVHRLTGQYVLDHHSASQCDPLYDVHRNCWIDEWCADIAPGLELPELVWPGEVAGTVSRRAAEATGIGAGTPVAAGTIDAWAEAASVGVRRPGDVMLMYGTTMFIVEVLSQPRSHPKLWGTVGLLEGTHNLAAGMATSGALTAWFKELVGHVSYDELIAEAAQVPPGSDGLVALPYFAGERTPLFDPLARGVFCGLTLRHGRGHLYRALLEATAYGVRHNLETMRAAGGRGARLVAVGGGTRGGLWTQIVSDVLGEAQEIPRETIGASYGDALLAGIAAGLCRLDGRWNRKAATVEPDDDAREVYDALYRIYRELYPSTRRHVHALAELQQEQATTKGGMSHAS